MKTSDSHQQPHSNSSHSEKPFFGAKAEQAFFSRERLHSKPFFNPSGASSTIPIQAKLTVGAVGDKYEQEADQVAVQVVDQINASASTATGEGQSVQRETMKEDDELQRTSMVQQNRNQSIQPQGIGSGIVQCKRVTLPNGTQANTKDLTNQQLQTYLANPSLSRALRPELEKELAARPAFAINHVISSFVASYNTFMGNYPNLIVANANTRIDELTNALATEDVNDYRLENYSSTLFSLQSLRGHMTAIDQKLAPPTNVSPKDADTAKNMITDLLIFSSLIPSQEKKRKLLFNFSGYSRYAIQVLSPNKVIEVLNDIHQKLLDPQNQDVYQADALRDLNLSDNDAILARMLKLSLLNVKAQIRQEFQQDQLFQDILASSHMAEVLFASNGADEQYFLNTCSISAKNADMASRASSIAVLLKVGRNLVDHLKQEISNPTLVQLKTLEQLETPEQLETSENKEKLTPRQTVEQLVKKRTEEAEKVFQDIETEARNLIQSQNFDYAKMKKLKQDWSRMMQKLGGVVNWETPKELPQLSKKYWKDHYYFSVVAGPLSTPNNPLRIHKRFTGADDSKYSSMTNQTIDPAPSGDEKVIAPASQSRLTRLWMNLYQVGGTSFRYKSLVGGHSLYMQAILRNGVRVFAINDPMTRTFEYKTFAEMVGYVGKHDPKVPGQLLRG